MPVKKPTFTPEQIRETVERARDHIDAVPKDLRPGTLELLKVADDGAEEFTTIGAFGIAKVWSITGLNPDYRAPAVGSDRASILAAIRNIGDDMAANEDREVAEAAAARKAALKMGMKIASAAATLILAGI